MKRHSKISVKANSISKSNGEAFKNDYEILDVSCDCGIECCDGFLKLPSYNSLTGETTAKAIYIVDGEIVISSVDSAKAAIKLLKKGTVVIDDDLPTPTPTSTPTSTPAPTSTPSPTPTPSGE